MSQFENLPWQPSSPALESEEVLDVFDTHWIKYLWPLFVAFLGTAIGILVLQMAGFGVINSTIALKVVFIAGFLLLGFTIHWTFHSIMSASMEDVVITNHRFIYLESSLWSLDEVHEVSLLQVKEVDSKKSGIIQNIFRFGSISFNAGGKDATRKEFPRIPHPDRKARIITNILRTAPQP